MNIDWTPQPDWRPRLLRICERLHRRQPAVRAFLVAGDYAHGVQAADSVLTCIAFFPDWRPDYTLGAVQALDGLPVALDWPTTAFLVEIEPALQDDVRAHRLATAQPLLSYDQTLDGVLRDFRDRYFAPDERAARVRRLCDGAAALIDHGGRARPGPEVEAWEAFVFGIGPALCHVVDEPPARRRLLPRFRAAARVRRMPSLAGQVAAAFALPERDAAEALRHAQDLRDLAEAHIRATHADAVSGLLPDWASAIEKGRRSVAVLQDDPEAAAFAAVVTGLVVDQAATAVSPGFRRSPGYRERASELYGRCDVAVLRHVLHEVRAAGE
ncbi:MAG: hypothetical protein F4Y94_03195 [Chloroflexi bacterium]|nr:hypothetical protein [Chloroflexota bacterium]